MTDAKALHAIRQFVDDNPSEPSEGIVNIRVTPTGFVGQRGGGNLPTIVRSGTTFGEVVGKLFEGTQYADAS